MKKLNLFHISGSRLRAVRLYCYSIAAAILVTPAISASTILVDDFNDGNDDGWTRIDSNLGQPWGPGSFDPSSGAYHLTTTGVVPGNAPGRGFLLSFWDQSSQPQYSDGFVRSKVRVDTPEGVAAIVFRFSGDLATGLDGYAFTALAGTGFFYNRIESTNLIEDRQVPGLVMGVGEDWWMEGGAVGDQISMKVWRDGEAEPISPQLTFTDSTFKAGLFGVDANMNFGSNVPGMVDTTFDDISFRGIPEPSSLLLVCAAIPAIVCRRYLRSRAR